MRPTLLEYLKEAGIMQHTTGEPNCWHIQHAYQFHASKLKHAHRIWCFLDPLDMPRLIANLELEPVRSHSAEFLISACTHYLLHGVGSQG